MMQTQNVSGMKCPQCEGFIPIEIWQITGAAPIVCPYCELSLTINKSESKEAIIALSKINSAMKNVKDTSQFKR